MHRSEILITSKLWNSRQGYDATLRALEESAVVEIARRLGRSAAQVILRWLTQSGIAVIPKASSELHMRDNLASFDFVLDEAAMTAMDSLDSRQGRFGPDPEVFDGIPRHPPAP